MRFRSLLSLWLTAVLASCTALFLPPEERVPTTLELSPAELVVSDGETLSVSALLLDQHGDPFEAIPPEMPVEWSVTDPELAVVQPGLVRGLKQGTGTLIVRVGDLTTGAKLTVRGVPRFLRPQGDTLRTGVVGRLVPTPVAVRVVDRLGTGVADIPVTFKVTAGAGSVAAATVKSDAAGIARVAWTLGPKAGSNALEATAGPLKDEVIRFGALAAPDLIAKLDRIAGDQQQAVAGSPLAKELVVKAVDKNGNIVPSTPVIWSADGGTVVPVSSVTDSLGIARARWTLGTLAGSMTAVARAGGQEVKFAASAVPGPPARLRIVKGDQQTGTEFRPLRDSLVVQVSDSYGNAIPGIPVAWDVTHGGGSVAVARTSTTDASGIARAVWTVGVSLPNAVTATAISQTVTFRAVARPLVPRDTLTIGGGLKYLEVDLTRDTLIVATGDMVAVYFSAYLLDGTLVERIEAKVNSPLRFIVGSGHVIRGFDQGVLGMRKDAIRRLFVPPELGYREGTAVNIPPNSLLVFDVRMVEIVKLGNGTGTGGTGDPSGSRLPGVPRPSLRVPQSGDSG